MTNGGAGKGDGGDLLGIAPVLPLARRATPRDEPADLLAAADVLDDLRAFARACVALSMSAPHADAPRAATALVLLHRVERALPDPFAALGRGEVEARVADVLATLADLDGAEAAPVIVTCARWLGGWGQDIEALLTAPRIDLPAVASVVHLSRVALTGYHLAALPPDAREAPADPAARAIPRQGPSRPPT